jgi:elongator complex protein 2
VFEAPRGFVELTEKLGVAQFSEEEVCVSCHPAGFSFLISVWQKLRPAAANVPPLGLSNKAISDGGLYIIFAIGCFDLLQDPKN